MEHIGSILAKNPLIAAAISFVSILDAANCIYLGHSDWAVPTFVALISAALVRPVDTK